MTIGARRAFKWTLLVAIAVAVGLLLWFVAFPYLTTLLPENF